MCFLNHPSNRRYPFPYPPGSPFPRPPPLAHPRPRGMAWLQMNPRPQTGGGAWPRAIEDENESPKGKMAQTDQTPQNTSMSTEYRHQTFHQWGTRRVERWTNIIQGDVLKRLMRAEERTHN